MYEPDIINTGKQIRDQFIKKEINYKYFKGNILIEFQDVTKNDGTPFKVFTPFWKNAEQKYLEKIPSKTYTLEKLDKSFTLFKNSINLNEILPKKKWYKKFEKYWNPAEAEAKTLSEIESSFEFNDSIMRHLVVRMTNAETSPSKLLMMYGKDRERKPAKSEVKDKGSKTKEEKMKVTEAKDQEANKDLDNKSEATLSESDTQKEEDSDEKI